MGSCGEGGGVGTEGDVLEGVKRVGYDVRGVNDAVNVDNVGSDGARG